MLPVIGEILKSPAKHNYSVMALFNGEFLFSYFQMKFKKYLFLLVCVVLMLFQYLLLLLFFIRKLGFCGK